MEYDYAQIIFPLIIRYGKESENGGVPSVPLSQPIEGWDNGTAGQEQ